MFKSAKSERKTLTESAQQELHQAITGGRFQPGSQLPTEAELCEVLGVSRTDVRTASIYNILQTSPGKVIEYGIAGLLRRQSRE
jgi:DNA-binding GntR family transcriptional regulator